MKKNAAILLILDGWGLGKDYPGNAIKVANTPNYDRLMENYPSGFLKASGESVGLPQGQMGNSEVGHLNIGAGRVVFQDLPKISRAIEDGSFFQKEEFLAAIENAKKKKSKVHLIGLVSDGGVHSHMKHLYGLLQLLKKEDMDHVYIHAILDGRDVAPNIGQEQLGQLVNKTKELGVGQIATVSGRYYSMDRDRRWERTKLGYDAMVKGQGVEARDPIQAVGRSYDQQVFDEFMLPTVIHKDGKPIGQVEDGDSIIFFNFRPDRARQITRAFVDEDFSGFDRGEKLETYYVTMTEYDKTIENVHVAYRSEVPDQTLSQYISGLGLKQIKIAETEKYAHVTFFLNGGIEEPYEGEDRILVDSPKVATYDLQPEMSAYQVRDQVVESIKKEYYDLMVVNFANPDMVGHTGIVEAVVKAVETVDTCLGDIVAEAERLGIKLLVTSDHGNAEMLSDSQGNPVTAHTTNQVPLILVGEEGATLKEGKLADLAPSLLDLMDIEKPKEMTGSSLIVRK